MPVLLAKVSGSFDVVLSFFDNTFKNNWPVWKAFDAVILIFNELIEILSACPAFWMVPQGLKST